MGQGSYVNASFRLPTGPNVAQIGPYVRGGFLKKDPQPTLQPEGYSQEAEQLRR